jgi:hypothetical protein
MESEVNRSRSGGSRRYYPIKKFPTVVTDMAKNVSQICILEDIKAVLIDFCIDISQIPVVTYLILTP